MQDLMTMITAIRRPRLLTRAAKIGARDYNRDRHLHRVLGYGAMPGTGSAIIRLIELEREIEQQRQEDDAAYSLVRHLDVLIALSGEAQLYQASRAARYQ